MISTDIREKLKDAMRAKDQVALDTYRGILAAFTNDLVAAGKTPQDEVTDDAALKVIQRVIKQRKDSINQFQSAGRTDLVETEQAQLVLLEQFQPAQMSEDDIRAIAVRKKTELNITDKAKVGILTGAVMKEVAGRADGAIVKQIVEALLNE